MWELLEDEPGAHVERGVDKVAPQETSSSSSPRPPDAASPCMGDAQGANRARKQDAFLIIMLCVHECIEPWVQVDGTLEAWAMVLVRLYPLPRPEMTVEAAEDLLPLVHKYNFKTIEMDVSVHSIAPCDKLTF